MIRERIEDVPAPANAGEIRLNQLAFEMLCSELDHAMLVRLWLQAHATRLTVPITVSGESETDPVTLVAPSDWNEEQIRAWIEHTEHDTLLLAAKVEEAEE